MANNPLAPIHQVQNGDKNYILSKIREDFIAHLQPHDRTQPLALRMVHATLAVTCPTGKQLRRTDYGTYLAFLPSVAHSLNMKDDEAHELGATLIGLGVGMRLEGNCWILEESMNTSHSTLWLTASSYAQQLHCVLPFRKMAAASLSLFLHSDKPGLPSIARLSKKNTSSLQLQQLRLWLQLLDTNIEPLREICHLWMARTLSMTHLSEIDSDTAQTLVDNCFVNIPLGLTEWPRFIQMIDSTSCNHALLETTDVRHWNGIFETSNADYRSTWSLSLIQLIMGLAGLLSTKESDFIPELATLPSPLNPSDLLKSLRGAPPRRYVQTLPSLFSNIPSAQVEGIISRLLPDTLNFSPPTGLQLFIARMLVNRIYNPHNSLYMLTPSFDDYSRSLASSTFQDLLMEKRLSQIVELAHRAYELSPELHIGWKQAITDSKAPGFSKPRIKAILNQIAQFGSDGPNPYFDPSVLTSEVVAQLEAISPSINNHYASDYRKRLVKAAVDLTAAEKNLSIAYFIAKPFEARPVTFTPSTSNELTLEIMVKRRRELVIATDAELIDVGCYTLADTGQVPNFILHLLRDKTLATTDMCKYLKIHLGDALIEIAQGLQKLSDPAKELLRFLANSHDAEQFTEEVHRLEEVYQRYIDRISHSHVQEVNVQRSLIVNLLAAWTPPSEEIELLRNEFNELLPDSTLPDPIKSDCLIYIRHLIRYAPIVQLHRREEELWGELARFAPTDRPVYAIGADLVLSNTLDGTIYTQWKWLKQYLPFSISEFTEVIPKAHELHQFVQTLKFLTEHFDVISSWILDPLEFENAEYNFDLSGPIDVRLQHSLDMSSVSKIAYMSYIWQQQSADNNTMEFRFAQEGLSLVLSDAPIHISALQLAAIQQASIYMLDRPDKSDKERPLLGRQLADFGTKIAAAFDYQRSLSFDKTISFTQKPRVELVQVDKDLRPMVSRLQNDRRNRVKVFNTACENSRIALLSRLEFEQLGSFISASRRQQLKSFAPSGGIPRRSHRTPDTTLTSSSWASITPYLRLCFPSERTIDERRGMLTRTTSTADFIADYASNCLSQSFPSLPSHSKPFQRVTTFASTNYPCTATDLLEFYTYIHGSLPHPSQILFCDPTLTTEQCELFLSRSLLPYFNYLFLHQVDLLNTESHSFVLNWVEKNLRSATRILAPVLISCSRFSNALVWNFVPEFSLDKSSRGSNATEKDIREASEEIFKASLRSHHIPTFVACTPDTEWSFSSMEPNAAIHKRLEIPLMDDFDPEDILSEILRVTASETPKLTESIPRSTVSNIEASLSVTSPTPTSPEEAFLGIFFHVSYYASYALFSRFLYDIVSLGVMRNSLTGKVVAFPSSAEKPISIYMHLENAFSIAVRPKANQFASSANRDLFKTRDPEKLQKLQKPAPPSWLDLRQFTLNSIPICALSYRPSFRSQKIQIELVPQLSNPPFVPPTVNHIQHNELLQRVYLDTMALFQTTSSEDEYLVRAYCSFLCSACHNTQPDAISPTFFIPLLDSNKLIFRDLFHYNTQEAKDLDDNVFFILERALDEKIREKTNEYGYAISPSIALSLLYLHSRFKTCINTIICGDTGLGKTELVKFFSWIMFNDKTLASGPPSSTPSTNTTPRAIYEESESGESWVQEPTEPKRNPRLVHELFMTKHKSFTEILESIRDAIYSATHYDGRTVMLFIDEFNTSSHMGVLESLLVRRLFPRELGDTNSTSLLKPLPKNLWIVCTMNPIETEPSMGEILETDRQDFSGIRATESPDRFIVQPSSSGLAMLTHEVGTDLREQDLESIVRGLLKPRGCRKAPPDLEILVFKLMTSHKHVTGFHVNGIHPKIRDLKRANEIFNFFWADGASLTILKEHFPVCHLLLNNLYQESNEQYEDEKLELVQRRWLALNLSLVFGYYLRLRPDNTKTTFSRRTLAKKVDSDDACGWLKGVNLEQASTVFRSFVLRNSELPPDIAATTTLGENLGAMLLSLLLSMPLIINSPTGCSKTLSMDILRDNMQGPSSPKLFFRQLPRLVTIRYQSSTSSTEEEVEELYIRGNNLRQRYNNLSDSSARDSFGTIVAIMMDEAGIPSFKEHAFKTLHFQLDRIDREKSKEMWENVLDATNLAPYKLRSHVCSIMFTNRWLDAAKTNRCMLVLQSDDRDIPDLQPIAQICLYRSRNPGQPDDLSTRLCNAFRTTKQLWRTRSHSLSKTNALRPDSRNRYWSIRDFVFFLRQLSAQYLRGSSFSEEMMSPEFFVRVLMRNFYGIDPRDFLEIVLPPFYNQAFHPNDLDRPIPQPIQCLALDPLLALSMSMIPDSSANLNQHNSRFTLILDPSNSEVAIDLLRNANLNDFRRQGYQIINDTSEMLDDQQIVQLAKEWVLALESGRQVLLIGGANLFSIFYDLFNRRFHKSLPLNGEDDTSSPVWYTNLGIGVLSHPFMVNPNFRLILHLPLSMLDSIPVPMRSRFETFILRASYVQAITTPWNSICQNQLRSFARICDSVSGSAPAFLGVDVQESVASVMLNIHQKGSITLPLHSASSDEMAPHQLHWMKLLLQVIRPEKLLQLPLFRFNGTARYKSSPDHIKAAQLYQWVMREYLIHQSHFSFVRWLQTVPTDPSRWIVYTRTTLDVEKLTTPEYIAKLKKATGKSDLRVVELNDFWKGSSAAIRAETLSSIERHTTFICTASIQDCSVSNIKMFQRMVEDIDMRSGTLGGGKGIVILLLHFPCSYLRSKTHFDTAWVSPFDFYFVDTLGLEESKQDFASLIATAWNLPSSTPSASLLTFDDTFEKIITKEISELIWSATKANNPLIDESDASNFNHALTGFGKELASVVDVSGPWKRSLSNMRSLVRSTCSLLSSTRENITMTNHLNNEIAMVIRKLTHTVFKHLLVGPPLATVVSMMQYTNFNQSNTIELSLETAELVIDPPQPPPTDSLVPSPSTARVASSKSSLVSIKKDLISNTRHSRTYLSICFQLFGWLVASSVDLPAEPQSTSLPPDQRLPFFDVIATFFCSKASSYEPRANHMLTELAEIFESTPDWKSAAIRNFLDKITPPWLPPHHAESLQNRIHDDFTSENSFLKSMEKAQKEGKHQRGDGGSTFTRALFGLTSEPLFALLPNLLDNDIPIVPDGTSCETPQHYLAGIVASSLKNGLTLISSQSWLGNFEQVLPFIPNLSDAPIPLARSYLHLLLTYYIGNSLPALQIVAEVFNDLIKFAPFSPRSIIRNAVEIHNSVSQLYTSALFPGNTSNPFQFLLNSWLVPLVIHLLQYHSYPVDKIAYYIDKLSNPETDQRTIDFFLWHDNEHSLVGEDDTIIGSLVYFHWGSKISMPPCPEKILLQAAQLGFVVPFIPESKALSFGASISALTRPKAKVIPSPILLQTELTKVENWLKLQARPSEMAQLIFQTLPTAEHISGLHPFLNTGQFPTISKHLADYRWHPNWNLASLRGVQSRDLRENSALLIPQDAATLTSKICESHLSWMSRDHLLIKDLCAALNEALKEAQHPLPLTEANVLEWLAIHGVSEHKVHRLRMAYENFSTAAVVTPWPKNNPRPPLSAGMVSDFVDHAQSTFATLNEAFDTFRNNANHHSTGLLTIINFCESLRLHLEARGLEYLVDPQTGLTTVELEEDIFLRMEDHIVNGPGALDAALQGAEVDTSWIERFRARFQVFFPVWNAWASCSKSSSFIKLKSPTSLSVEEAMILLTQLLEMRKWLERIRSNTPKPGQQRELPYVDRTNLLSSIHIPFDSSILEYVARWLEYRLTGIRADPTAFGWAVAFGFCHGAVAISVPALPDLSVHFPILYATRRRRQTENLWSLIQQHMPEAIILKDTDGLQARLSDLRDKFALRDRSSPLSIGNLSWVDMEQKRNLLLEQGTTTDDLEDLAYAASRFLAEFTQEGGAHASPSSTQLDTIHEIETELMELNTDDIKIVKSLTKYLDMLLEILNNVRPFDTLPEPLVARFRPKFEELLAVSDIPLCTNTWSIIKQDAKQVLPQKISELLTQALVEVGEDPLECYIPSHECRAQFTRSQNGTNGTKVTYQLLHTPQMKLMCEPQILRKFAEEITMQSITSAKRWILRWQRILQLHEERLSSSRTAINHLSTSYISSIPNPFYVTAPVVTVQQAEEDKTNQDSTTQSDEPDLFTALDLSQSRGVSEQSRSSTSYSGTLFPPNPLSGEIPHYSILNLVSSSKLSSNETDREFLQRISTELPDVAVPMRTKLISYTGSSWVEDPSTSSGVRPIRLMDILPSAIEHIIQCYNITARSDGLVSKVCLTAKNPNPTLAQLNPSPFFGSGLSIVLTSSTATAQTLVMIDCLIIDGLSPSTEERDVLVLPGHDGTWHYDILLSEFLTTSSPTYYLESLSQTSPVGTPTKFLPHASSASEGSLTVFKSSNSSIKPTHSASAEQLVFLRTNMLQSQQKLEHRIDPKSVPLSLASSSDSLTLSTTSKTPVPPPRHTLSPPTGLMSPLTPPALSSKSLHPALIMPQKLDAHRLRTLWLLVFLYEPQMPPGIGDFLLETTERSVCSNRAHCKSFLFLVRSEDVPGLDLYTLATRLLRDCLFKPGGTTRPTGLAEIRKLCAKLPILPVLFGATDMAFRARSRNSDAMQHYKVKLKVLKVLLSACQTDQTSVPVEGVASWLSYFDNECEPLSILSNSLLKYIK